MWYSMADSTKHYPLSIETVKKIKAQNKQGIKPEALETVEIVSAKPKEVEPEFVDVVGQISLKSLEKNHQKRKANQRQNDKRTNVSDNGTASRKTPNNPNNRPPKSQNKNNQRQNKRPPGKES